MQAARAIKPACDTTFASGDMKQNGMTFNKGVDKPANVKPDWRSTIRRDKTDSIRLPLPLQGNFVPIQARVDVLPRMPHPVKSFSQKSE